MRSAAQITIVASCLVTLLVVGTVCQPSSSSLPPAPQGEGPGSAEFVVEDVRVLLTEFLPTGHVRDASVDYSIELRAAARAAAGGVLVLPGFPVLVSRDGGEHWCVRITEPTTITGTTGSALVVLQEDAQVLRAEGVDGLVLRDFAIVGTGNDGAGLAHGLVQVFQASDVRIEGLRVDGADADGIAVARARDVTIEDCVVTNASKAALYVNHSERVHVRGNAVADFGGHRTAASEVVGVGIQLSGNRDVVCSGNVVAGGLGVGILCNALSGGDPPIGSLITDNRVRNVANPTNPESSSGIRLANGSGEPFTQTVVRGNSIRGCGRYGVYVENHDGALVESNSIAESERSGIAVGTSSDVLVARNLVLNSGTDGEVDRDAVLLINGATGVVVRDNTLRNASSAAPASGRERVGDVTQGTRNAVHPRTSAGDGPPSSGRWFFGDVVLNVAPGYSGPMGWVCVTAGEPGVWRAFGQ